MPIRPIANGALSAQVLLNGKALPATTPLIDISITDQLDDIPHARITLGDASSGRLAFPLSASENLTPGTKVEIRAGFGRARAQSLFQGIITGTGFELGKSNEATLSVTCHASAIRLTRSRTATVFQDMSDADIMTHLITTAGLTADIADTTVTRTSHLPHGTSDWEALKHLAARNGHVLRIQDDRIVSAPPDLKTEAPLVVTAGQDILSYQSSFDATALLSSTTATSWDSKSGTLRSHTARSLPASKWGARKLAELATAQGEAAPQITLAADTDQADLKTTATMRMAQATLSAHQGTCSFTGSSLAQAGTLLQLKGLGKAETGSAYISTVSHHIADGTWTTTTDLGMTAHPATQSQPDPDLTGTALQIALVTAITPDPQGLMRIEIHLPTSGATLWARMAQPYASDGAGFQTLPEIGDEVVVAGLQSDSGSPVILGAMHSPSRPRPEPAEADNTGKLLRTRSGLELRFDDDDTSIALKTPDGRKLVLDDTRILLEDDHGNRIEMSATSGITLSSDRDITLNSGRKITADADQDLTLKGSNIGAQADIKATFRGLGSTELTSPGTTKITGAMVNIN